QLRNVFEAHVAGLQLLVIEHAHAAMPDDVVAVEGEVDLFDAMAFGAGAEFGLGAGRAAAEQDVVGSVHDEESIRSASICASVRSPSSSTRWFALPRWPCSSQPSSRPSSPAPPLFLRPSMLPPAR